MGCDWDYSGGDELVGYKGIKLKLEGPAMVGNSFRYRTYFKEVQYESGEVRRVIEKITVESNKMKSYESEMLKTSKVGENQPGTQ